jgi:hypothetical protein
MIRFLNKTYRIGRFRFYVTTDEDDLVGWYIFKGDYLFNNGYRLFNRKIGIHKWNNLKI